MKIIISDFESKTEEINEYFTFIENTTHLRSFGNNNKKIQVTKRIHNILKANLFLLLYNLIESSFKNGLGEVCSRITNDKLKYKNVIPELKKMWIKDEYKNFDKNPPCGIKKSDYLIEKIDNIAEDIIEINFNNKNNSGISGNLNASEICKINSLYGVDIKKDSGINPKSLNTIKEKRNSLAHGDETFDSCGGNYSLDDLKELKDNSLDYMKFILNHLEDFLNQKKYKV